MPVISKLFVQCKSLIRCCCCCSPRYHRERNESESEHFIPGGKTVSQYGSGNSDILMEEEGKGGVARFVGPWKQTEYYDKCYFSGVSDGEIESDFEEYPNTNGRKSPATISLISAKSEVGRGSSRMVPSHQRSSAYEDDLSSSLSGTELKQFPCSFDNERSPSLKSCASAKSEVGREMGELAVSISMRSSSISSRHSVSEKTTLEPPKDEPCLGNELDLPFLKNQVVPTVAAKMKPFGIFLGIENTVVDKVKMNYPMDCERACEEMLKLWLAWDNGTGKRLRTRATVIDALEKAEFKEQAQALRNQLLK